MTPDGRSLIIDKDIAWYLEHGGEIMAKGPESKVKDEIKAELTKLGAYFFMPVQMGFGARTVDILACLAGKFLAVECKRPEGGVLTSNQRGVLAAVRRAGGIAVVATSWADVAEALGV